MIDKVSLFSWLTTSMWLARDAKHPVWSKYNSRTAPRLERSQRRKSCHSNAVEERQLEVDRSSLVTKCNPTSSMRPHQLVQLGSFSRFCCVSGATLGAKQCTSGSCSCKAREVRPSEPSSNKTMSLGRP